MAKGDRDRRLNARMTAHEGRSLRDAAAELGKPVSRFVIAASVERGRDALADTHVRRIADQAAERFEVWLDGPATPVPAATRLADAEPFERT